MNKQLKKNTRKQVNQKKLKTRTKVIVRRLPPNLPEDVFYDSISEWLESITWKSYFPGKLSKSKAKENVFSRAYLNFKNIETLVEFFKEFDGHMYIDSKGNEYQALVEFSLYQMIPKKRKNVDSKQNTIEKDHHYLAFLESLKPKEPENSGEDKAAEETENQKTEIIIQPSMVTGISHIDPITPQKPKSTPLLDALRQQKNALKASLEQNKLANIAKLQEKERKEKELEEKRKQLQEKLQKDKEKKEAAAKEKKENPAKDKKDTASKDNKDSKSQSKSKSKDNSDSKSSSKNNSPASSTMILRRSISSTGLKKKISIVMKTRTDLTNTNTNNSPSTGNRSNNSSNPSSIPNSPKIKNDTSSNNNPVTSNHSSNNNSMENLSKTNSESNLSAISDTRSVNSNATGGSNANSNNNNSNKGKMDKRRNNGSFSGGGNKYGYGNNYGYGGGYNNGGNRNNKNNQKSRDGRDNSSSGNNSNRNSYSKKNGGGNNNNNKNNNKGYNRKPSMNSMKGPNNSNSGSNSGSGKGPKVTILKRDGTKTTFNV